MVARRAHNPEAAGSSPASATIKVLISQEIRTFSAFFRPTTCSLFSLTQAPTPTVRAAESTIPHQRECCPLVLPLYAWLRPLHEHRCPARSSRSSSPTWRERFLRPRRFAAEKRRTGPRHDEKEAVLTGRTPPFFNLSRPQGLTHRRSKAVSASLSRRSLRHRSRAALCLIYPQSHIGETFRCPQRCTA